MKNDRKNEKKSHLFINKEVKPKKEAMRITIIYIIVGILWILYSDNLLKLLVNDHEIFHKIQTYKGIAFVLATGQITYLLIYKRMVLLKDAVKELVVNYKEVVSANKDLVGAKTKLQEQNIKLEKSMDAVKISEERYELVVNGSNDGIWDWDIKNDIYLFSLYNITSKYKGKENTTRESWENLIHPEDREKAILKINKYLQGKKTTYESTYRLLVEEEYFWILSKGKAKWDGNGNPVRMAGSHTDITKYVILQDQLEKLAYYDTLTGLPNRTMVNEQFEQELIKSQEAYVLYLDIDNFKQINDSVGHISGDELLKKISKMLLHLIAPPKTIARLSGDEFLIILPDEEDVEWIMEMILTNLRQPFYIKNLEFNISASIGVAKYPQHGNDLNTLLKNADTAMFHAKENGKNKYCFYNLEMEVNTIKHIHMINEIKHCINERNFELYYQPIIDLASGELVGLEALIRWFHKEKGAISPSYFIPLAEETGYIKDITNWVFKTSLDQKSIWEEKYNISLEMSINLSSSLMNKEFIRESPIFNMKDIRGVQIEITETAVLKDINKSLKAVQELKDMGVTIALDDFGTGYSSLTYLKKLPIDVLKIDREFIKNIQEKKEEVIIENVIRLAHDLSLKVIAEGIENNEQLNYLKKHHCDFGQGYLLCEPASKEIIEGYLSNNKLFL
ncbi:MAG: putative bifunctional diguanylate cyclase/phosphodiesterase [Eubacteriaceae bacterium]